MYISCTNLAIYVCFFQFFYVSLVLRQKTLTQIFFIVGKTLTGTLKTMENIVAVSV